MTRFTIFAICVMQCMACSVVTPHRVYPARRADPHSIAVLTNKQNRLIETHIQHFAAQVSDKVVVYTLPPEASPSYTLALTKAINKQKPHLLYTIGGNATRLALTQMVHIPLLFSMTLNYHRLPLQNHTRVMGIALETHPIVEFTKFKMIIPTLRRVLAFYSPENSKELVAAAATALREKLDIELIAIPVTSSEQIEPLYDMHINTVDGVWLLNDPVVMNAATFHFLRARSMRDRIPFFTSLSHVFAREGALMSVAVDFRNLSSQAASMARLHLEHGQSPREIGIQPPIGGNLVLNLDVARHIGLLIPEEILQYVNEIIRSAPRGADK